MRYLLLLTVLLSCTQKSSHPDADEYVLIEFAGKLEEDYEKNGGATLK